MTSESGWQHQTNESQEYESVDEEMFVTCGQGYEMNLPKGYEPHEIPADYTGPLYLEGQIAEAIRQALDDEKQNEWKNVIIQELIVDGILTQEHENNPILALQDAITWNCQVVIDPAVSSDASKLIRQAKREALLEAANELQGVPDDYSRAFMMITLRNMAEELK
jgi:hypothetical protein